MSKENKPTTTTTTTDRPKVRFCQPLSEKSTFENFESVSKKTITKKKPRITSVINLENSSKILYNENGNLVNCDKIIVENKGFSSFSNNDNKKKSFTCLQENDTTKIPFDMIDDIEKTSSFDDGKKNDEKRSADGMNKIIKSSIKDENKIQSIESNTKGVKKKNSDIIEKKNNRSKIDEAKICSSKILTNKSSICNKLTKKFLNEGKISTTTTTTTTMKNRNDKSSNLCFGRGLTTSSLSCSKNVKPCIKTWKTRSKNSPVKKTILRDVSVKSTKVYVGPGITRYYPQTFKDDSKIRADIVSAEKLARPEYNSIICTIEELKKVKSEKFVKNVEHLPIFYKNLVNEKVSAALDFPPDEAIFKNLVDISVSEDQLPSRFTRSKDPEPRNRDVTPSLSDFFTPSYSEEYCSAVNIKPVIQDTVSNWKAFVISDKILGWKQDMDQYL